MIGAHEREKAANQNSEARKEYSRIYNKLKARKQRGTISTDLWNRQVAAAQQLKDAFAEGRIGKEEYVQQLDALWRRTVALGSPGSSDAFGGDISAHSLHFWRCWPYRMENISFFRWWGDPFSPSRKCSLMEHTKR